MLSSVLKPESQIRLILAVILSASALPVAAASADIDPAKAAAIRELLEVTGAQANRKELTRTFTGQLISVLQANNANLSNHAMSIIRDEVDAVVEEQLRSEALQMKMYRIYARYFTLEEIRGLIEFNRSPIGIKANRVMPILMRESMSAAQEWSEEIGPELSRRVTARLKNEGISIGQ